VTALASPVAGEAARAKRTPIVRPSTLAWRSFRGDRAAMLGTLMVATLLAVALLCPLLAPFDPLATAPERQLLPPSGEHWLGTDRFGRDQLSRLLYATRTSIAVTVGSVAVAVALGVPLGLVSGYRGGRVDGVVMRLLDVVFAFPGILLALIVVGLLGPSPLNLLLTIGIIFAAQIARVTRGTALSVRERDFIEAVRALGARDLSILAFSILPNVVSPIIVQATYYLSFAIQVEAGLSFLGLDTQPPTPAWGLMLNESRRFIETAPWLSVFPGLAIVFAVLAFNLTGDGLRDALDPRLARR
jgi:peptide/nickel transport system permease protein